MIIDRDKHNKYVVGWKPNYTVPTNQGSSSGTNVTIVYGGGGSGSSTPVSSEAFSYYKVSDGENAITQEAKVQKDIANLSIIGDEGIKVELITDPTIFEASFTSTGTNKGVYKISYGKVTTVVEEPVTQAEEPTEPEVVVTFPMTITYVSGEKIKAEQFDTLRLLNDTEEVATYPSSGLTIEGDADGILSISLEVYKEVQSVDEEGKPVQDAEGNPVMEKQGLYFNRILLTTQLEDQPSTQAEGDSTEEEPQQPTYESLLSFDVVVNIDTVIKLSVTAVSDLWKLDDNGNIYTEYNAYSLKELSAYGLGEGEAGDIAGYLYELGDVNIPDPNAIPDNAILQYNIETGKWEAVELELPEDSATREWVEQKFKDLINGAPADLDTLGEIAIAIQELQQLLDWFSFVDGRIRANYNFWGVGEVSAYGPASGSDPGTGGGAGYLHELGDVTINNDTLTDGQIIVWDEDSQMWVNTDFPGLDEDALALYLTQNKYATQEWVKGQLDPINNKLEEFQTTIDMINDMFEWDNGKIKAKATLYSVGEISAYGAGEGSSGTDGFLHELGDVLLTSLQDDQLLMYDATIEKWVNVDKDEVGLNETQLAQYLTEHNYAIMSNVVPITRRIIAGDGLQGGGPLSSDVTLSMAPLTASDIPGLDWSKIISGKPTTLAGYGITDGVNAVSVTGTGNAVTTASISGHTLTLTKALSFALITGTNATGTWPISITGNAATANKWATARTITLAGAVIGSTSIDGSGNVTITTTYTTDNISALDGRYVNVTGDTMTGNLILPTLQANTSIILGSVKLEYDSASNALKISNVNTQQVINLYATGEISAYGYNSGSAGGGASTLNDLDDVTLSNLQNGQALVYNSSTGQWINTTIQAGGIDETALAQYLTNNQYLTMPTGDGRYVKKAGDTMTGTLTLSTTGTVSYNQGIRINRTSFNQWATLTIGYVGTATAGTSANTWLIGTPGSSNSLIFNLNNSYESVGLCLKGHGNNDMKWNNNTVFHAGNYTSTLDTRYVKKSGDTMTGSLTLNTNGLNDGINIGGISITRQDDNTGLVILNTNGIIRFGDKNWDFNHWAGLRYVHSNKYLYLGIADGSVFTANAAQSGGSIITPGISNIFVGNNTTNKVWHAGNDGSGSGLDADLLDGLQATAFLRNLTVGNVDFNTLTTSGVYRLNYTVSNGASNGPSGGEWSQMLVMHGSSDTIAQLVVGYNTHQVYIRSGNPSNVGGSGSWSSWYTLARTVDNVYSASRLQTARTINGTAFNGTSNIVTSYWGTSRTLSLTGNATGSVSMNGSANVSMSVNVNYATSAGNADTLDGYHASSFLIRRDGEPDGTSFGFGFWNNVGSYASFAVGNWGGQFRLSGNPSYRYVNAGTPGAWREMAFLTSNVASASKLQTARTIWGQPFNGTANVSGNMTGVGSISAIGEIKSGSANAFRLTYGNYGVILRNDGSQFYLLTTASGQSAIGGWNSLRPFYFSLTTGRVTMANGLDVSTITASGNITAPSFYASNWFRTTGQTGWYSETYGGGWYMTDTTYLRAYGSKKIHTPNASNDAFNSSGGYYSSWNNNYALNATNILNPSYAVLNKPNQGVAYNGYCQPMIAWCNQGNGYGYVTRYSIASVRQSNGWGSMRLSVGNNDRGTSIGAYIDIHGGGTITLGGTTHGTGGIYSDSYVSAKGNNSSSDIRLKNILCNIHPSLKDFAKAPLFRFAWKSDPGMVEIGSSAQYWRNVLPDTVKERDGWLEMGYGNIALAGVITIAREMETLEQRVDRLEKENNKLKAKLSKLERRIR